MVPETGGIYLTDLDSTRFLEVCGEVERSWQVLRDAVSGLVSCRYGFSVEIIQRHKVIEAYLRHRQ